MKTNLSLRFLIIFCLTYLVGVSCHTLYLYNHREFGPKDFYHPFIVNRAPTFPNEPSKKIAQEILRQKFTYLSYGGQMTVYESEDHHYVIKFFNPRSVIKENWFHRIPKLMRINSWKWISNTYFRQKERLEKYFYRYEMSFSDLKEETALIYIHLDPGTSLSQSLKLVDKKGIHHLLNLETHPFILQKKVDLTFTHLNKLIKAGQVEEAKEATRQIYSFFLSRAQKGYKDRFQALEKNYGFIEGKFVQFDTGRLRKDEAVFQNPYPETKRIILNIKPSLFNFPELLEVLDTCLKLELK